MENEDYYYVVPVDHGFHTDAHPFCDDPACPDKEDQKAIEELSNMVQDGLLTPSEASSIHAGKPSTYGW